MGSKVEEKQERKKAGKGKDKDKRKINFRDQNIYQQAPQAWERRKGVDLYTGITKEKLMYPPQGLPPPPSLPQIELELIKATLPVDHVLEVQVSRFVAFVNDKKLWVLCIEASSSLKPN